MGGIKDPVPADLTLPSPLSFIKDKTLAELTETLTLTINLMKDQVLAELNACIKEEPPPAPAPNLARARGGFAKLKSSMMGDEFMYM